MIAGMRSSLPQSLPRGATSWLEIDLGAIESNVRAFRERLPEHTAIAAIVKGNAYGHGVELVAPAALRAGATWLGVINLAEALQLRQLVGPEPPILVLGAVPPHAVDQAVAEDIRLTLFDEDVLEAAAAAGRRMGRPARLHLKLETGTHRLGVETACAVSWARRIASEPGVELEGLSTHFADIEDTTDHAFASGQIERFGEACMAVKTALTVAARDNPVSTPLEHTACSAAAILFPETHLDIARVGVSLYGLWPSPATFVSARERGLGSFALTPAMTWKTVIAQVKDVPAGGFVGYGRTWRASRPSRIAVLPVGYYEGYARSLSSRAYVLVAGRRAQVVGRICMNVTMVDVTDVPDVTAGQTVVLLGRDGDEVLRAEQLGDWAGTIHYEMVSRIHPDLPRLPSP